jgi:hypothetical protein
MVECLEDRKLLSANGLAGWITSLVPVPPAAPAALAPPANDGGEASAPAAAPTAFDGHSRQDEGGGKEQEGRPNIFDGHSQQDEGGAKEIAKSEDALGTFVSSAGSLATRVLDVAVSTGNVEDKVEPVAKHVAVGLIPKPSDLDPDKGEVVATRVATTTAVLAGHLNKDETPTGRADPVADRKEDAALMAGFFDAAQPGTDAKAGIAVSEAVSAVEPPGVLGGAIEASSHNLRGYQDVALVQNTPFWIAADENGTDVQDRFALRAFLDSGTPDEEALLPSDLPERLAEFSPEPGSSLDLNLGQMLTQVGDLGRQLGQSLAGSELTRWLLALATASAAYVAVRQRRRVYPRVGLLGGAEDTTLTLAPCWPGPFTIEDP